jgi:hypothetical protein
MHQWHHGGRPSLNQTLQLEKDVSYGGTAVRFTSVRLQHFYDHRENEHDEPVWGPSLNKQQTLMVILKIVNV